PGVSPVRTALALDWEQLVRQAWSKVTEWVDGVAGGSTKGQADGNNQQCYGQWAQLVRSLAQASDHEDQDEGTEDLGDHVPSVGADSRAGCEDAQLVPGILRVIKVLLVGQPDAHGTKECADELRQEIQQGVGQGDGNSRS